MTDIISDIDMWWCTDFQEDCEDVSMDHARLLIEDKGRPPTAEEIAASTAMLDDMARARGDVEVKPGTWMTPKMARSS